MTDHSASLALARAVYPEREWFDDAGMCWQSIAERTGYALSMFDPRNNADQFVDVLVWLMNNDPQAYAILNLFTNHTKESYMNDAVVAAQHSAERVANG